MYNRSRISLILQQGLRRLQGGDQSEAKTLFEEVLGIDETNSDAHHFLGVVAMERGQREVAHRYLKGAIRLRPNEAKFHNSLGVFLVRERRFPFAIHHFWQAIALQPDYVDGLKNLANALADIGDHEESLQMAERALKFAPDVVEILFIKARSLQRMGRIDEAADQFDAILKNRPDYVPARTEYGFICLDRDEYEMARRHLQQAVQSAPKNSRGIQGLGLVYERLGDIDKAVDTWERCLKISPNEPQVLTSLGQCSIQVGRIDQGREYLNHAIRLSPRSAEAHLGLAMSGKATESDPQIARLAMLIDDAGIVGDQRVRMHFALGKLYEDTKQFEKAFEQYQSGNQLKRGMIEYDSQQTTTTVNSYIDFFSRDRLRKPPASYSSVSSKPLFVLGMPRSGTTLVEQILASHPSIHGAGELSHLEKLVRRMPEMVEPQVSFPFCLERLSNEQLHDEASAYADMLERVAPDAARVVDKMPKNFFYAGLITMMWPNAKIVWCRRDPLDTCISCYNRFFIKGQPFSWDFEELGHYFSEHERLGKHWQQSLPTQMFEINYEELTETPEPIVRSLIDYVELPWDDQCLRFHETDRRVKTNPLQVRQPIYKTSVSRASRFEPWIGPLKNALQ